MMIKKIVIIKSFLILLALLLLFASSVSAIIIDQIVAKINGEIVTLSELQELRLRLTSQLKAAAPNEANHFKGVISERELLENLINRKLEIQKAEKLGIEITNIEIDNTINDIATSNKLTKEGLSKALANEGLTLEDFRKQIKEEMILTRVLSNEVRSKIVVDSQDAWEYYQSRQKEYSKPEIVRLRHIFIKVKDIDDRAGYEKGMEKARKTIELYEKGESFSSLARQFSDDPSAGKGGDIGLLKVEDLMDPLRENAAKLKAGEISPIICSKIGFHIIYVEEKTGSGMRPFEEVKKDIEKQLYQKKLEDRIKTWLSQLREKAHIEISYQEINAKAN